jgi:putative acetyltransferase
MNADSQACAIRPESPDYFAAVENVTRLAFGDGVEVRILQRIRSLPEYIPALSLLAELDGKVIGHVLLSHMHHEAADWEGKLLALGPISVEPPFQRRGIGSALMQAAAIRAREMGFAAILLIGHPTYYPRFGFRPASTWGLRFQYIVPDEAAMALELLPGSLEGSAGQIRYSPAFPD